MLGGVADMKQSSYDIDLELDHYLKIRTSGRDDSNSDFTNFPYEPTPYKVLERLANSGYINKKDKIIDYGCGKGRVDFYLSYFTKAQMIGVELDERRYQAAVENQKTSICPFRVLFVHQSAEQYELEDDVTAAYFFNPFSSKIFTMVYVNIIQSLIRRERHFKLFFYYPSDAYRKLLESIPAIRHLEDIDCRDVTNSEDEKEYVGIYEINPW